MNIPILRFPEFKGEWEKKKLGEVATNKSGKYNPEKEITSVKCIELEHLGQESAHLLGFIDGKNSGCIKNKFDKGDVLFGKLRPYLKKYLIAPFEGVCSSEIWVLKGINISNEFLFRIIQTDTFIDLANQSSGSKMPRADWSVVENGIFSFPTLPEQTRIAEFFTAIDAKIQALKTKKEKLAQYKKGVMQKIFANVETHGRASLRFTDDNGNDFPEWEVKKLGEVSKITTGKLDANAMVENGEYRFYTCAKDFYRIDKFAFDTEALLISGNGANVGYIHYYNGKFNAYQRTYVLDGFNENIIFIKYFLDKNLYERINIEKKEGNTPYIVLSTLSEMEIRLPSLPEQTKIANFLSSLDEKINSTENQIQQTQTWKKGLLQKMFV